MIFGISKIHCGVAFHPPSLISQNKKLQQKRNSSRFPYFFTSTKILTCSRHPG